MVWCLVISSGPWALNPILAKEETEILGENPEGWGGLARWPLLPSCLFLAQPQNHQAFRGPPEPPLPALNSQQVTASLGSDRWGTDKGGPRALPGGGMGPQLSLWGCLRPISGIPPA